MGAIKWHISIPCVFAPHVPIRKSKKTDYCVDIENRKYQNPKVKNLAIVATYENL